MRKTIQFFRQHNDNGIVISSANYQRINIHFISSFFFETFFSHSFHFDWNDGLHTIHLQQHFHFDAFLHVKTMAWVTQFLLNFFSCSILLMNVHIFFKNILSKKCSLWITSTCRWPFVRCFEIKELRVYLFKEKIENNGNFIEWDANEIFQLYGTNFHFSEAIHRSNVNWNSTTIYNEFEMMLIICCFVVQFKHTALQMVVDGSTNVLNVLFGEQNKWSNFSLAKWNSISWLCAHELPRVCCKHESNNIVSMNDFYPILNRICSLFRKNAFWTCNSGLFSTGRANKMPWKGF